jgi:hypothetical protein
MTGANVVRDFAARLVKVEQACRAQAVVLCGSTGSASADGAVIMNAVITPTAYNPAGPVRLIRGMVM